MDNDRILAYLLIGVGLLFLLARLELGSSWLWLAVIAAVCLVGYARQKRYGLLVIGCVLAGLALGLMLGGWTLVMLGLAAGFLAIDRVEPRESRWPLITAGVLAGIGVLGWLIDAGFVGSLLFSLLLIGVGLYLLVRGDTAKRDAMSPLASPSASPSAASTETPTPDSTAPITAVAPQPTAPATPEMPPSTPDVPTRAAPAPSATPSGATPPGAPPDTAEDTEAPLDETGEALVARLEAWRRETAAAEGRAAYLILTNDTLREIARRRPRTPEELRAIRGIGPVKLERYGDALLAITADQATTTDQGGGAEASV